VSDGDESLGQEVGAQGALSQPEWLRGREQTIDSPLRYGSVMKQRREAHIEVREPRGRTKTDRQSKDSASCLRDASPVTEKAAEQSASADATRNRRKPAQRR